MTETQNTAAFTGKIFRDASTNNVVPIDSNRNRKVCDEKSNRWSGEVTVNNVVPIDSNRNRKVCDEQGNRWSGEVTVRLQNLIRLAPGWDGYQARPVSFVNANFAYQMLNSICGPETPAPQIVPGAAGDLQIEWHTLRGDIELHVRGPNDVHAWRAISGSDPDGKELNLTVNFVDVAQWVKEVTEAQIAAETAA